MSGAEGAILLSIPEVIKTIKEIIVLVNDRNKNLVLQQMEARENLDTRLRLVNGRHLLYYDEVFYPLYRNVIAINVQSYNLISYVIFTALDVSKSLHYKEALEHLNQDIPDFSTKLGELQDLINMFNSDLKDFQEQRLQHLIVDHIIQNGLTVNEDHNKISGAGAIEVQYVLEALKDYWKDNKEIRYIRRNNELRIPISMGHATIAIINEQVDVDKIQEILDQLKDLDKVKIEFNKFLDEYIQIDLLSRQLSTEIGNKVIKLIQNGEYDYTCKLCLDKTFI